MMRYWITPDGSYYEGEHVAEGSIEVAQRPSRIHSWDGQAWAIDAALQAKQAREINDESEHLDGKNDAAIIALLDQTKSQWIAWVTTNLPSIATAPERNRIGTLFWVVAMCARKILR